MSAMLAERILAREGYQVAVYPSGEALLAVLDGSHHSAICLDLSLPGIDGLTTLREIKRRRPQLPVILLTASADDVRAEALAAGAIACVSKAGAWSELRTVVAEVLNGST